MTWVTLTFCININQKWIFAQPILYSISYDYGTFLPRPLVKYSLDIKAMKAVTFMLLFNPF